MTRIGRAGVVLLAVWLCAGSASAQTTIVPQFSTRPFANLFQGTVTVNTQPTINATVTWNAASVTFYGWDFQITDTNSASGSLPIRIRGGAAGTTTLFSVDKTGAAVFGAGVTASTATLDAGSGTATYTPSGVIKVDTTQAGTDANTNEKTLWSYSLPANTLSADGKALRVFVSGTFAANGNSKTVRLKFGSATPLTVAVSSNDRTWWARLLIIRTASGAQIVTPEYADSTVGVATVALATTAIDETAAITISMTGQNGSGSANDIVYRLAVVEVLN